MVKMEWVWIACIATITVFAVIGINSTMIYLYCQHDSTVYSETYHYPVIDIGLYNDCVNRAGGGFMYWHVRIV